MNTSPLDASAQVSDTQQRSAMSGRSWREWRSLGGRLTNGGWLEGRRAVDGAEGLWRVHHDLYDLSDWADAHPGGAQWLHCTKGTDITEAFECHHVGPLAAKMLTKFHVRSAKTPRNSPFTFKSDGFYRTFKARAYEQLKHTKPGPSSHSKRYLETLATGAVVLSVLASAGRSFLLGTCAGVLLALSSTCAHNFFHMRDNWRMYLFNLSLLTVRQWRISHALSHHLYPNTQYDLEISMLEPFMKYLPNPEKSKVLGAASAIYSPFLYPFFHFAEALKRLALEPARPEDAVCLALPTAMHLLGGVPLLDTLAMWAFLHAVASFTFALIGLNAAHHHPHIFHEGDTPREDRDWGLFTLDATRDRVEVHGVPYLVLITFGDHCLHHLLPTVDHVHLAALYPLLRQTCQDFGVEFRFTTTWQLVAGQFRQLMRNKPNENPPCPT